MKEKRKKGPNEKLQKIRTGISFLSACGIILIFALFCSGRVGWFYLLAILLAPAFSVLSLQFLGKDLDIEVTPTEALCGKGDRFLLTIHLKNKSFLPMPGIQLQLVENGHLKTERKTFWISLFSKEERNIQIPYSCEYSGGSYAGIDSLWVQDFFGITKKQISISDSEKTLVGILPSILEMTDNHPVLSPLLEHTILQGDQEEPIEEASRVFGGTPGYEYREYVPGDPLKRIHSKLSAKKDQLFVRLDDKLTVSTMSFFCTTGFSALELESSDLFPFVSSLEKKALLCQNALELSMGIVFAFLKREYAVEFYLEKEDGWKKLLILKEEDLVSLSRELASVILREVKPSEWVVSEELIQQADGHKVFLFPNMTMTQRKQIEQLESASAEPISVVDVSEIERGKVV